MNTLKHLAIIMDGNGRWAKERGKIRSFGHVAGAKKLVEITKHASRIGIEYLTLYSFSTENWKREKVEVDFLMKLIEKFLKQELKNLMDNNIRFKVIGDMSKTSKSLQKRVNLTIEKTKNNTGLTQILAINYGARDEIVRAINSIKKEKITEEDIQNALDTHTLPDVDLMIRTGGEQRLSNFLLWQSAYAELIFTDTYWPAFSTQELDIMIEKYQKIQRRFGGI
ncbi:polyprenyl diphosphate synthase [Sulfurospirillum sp. 1612]|uniref:polyprenyl diphosphate synthase n=1 Tax=Sulfurospirillum sp. 1612 TaxID=3094835 RepID=UPI002F956ACF